MEPAEQMIERLVQEVRNQVYAACVKPYEEAERAGIILGNGHHMAQISAMAAAKLLRERYDRNAQIDEAFPVNTGEAPSSNE